MAFTSGQVEEIKKKIIEQVGTLPNENKEEIKEYVSKLDGAGLEKFLKQNNISVSDSGLEQDKSIFELILQNQTPSYKIAEDDTSLAILEINPVSEGHVLVIPKEKTELSEVIEKTKELTEKISNKLKEKLNPDEVGIKEFEIQGYSAVSVLPMYKDRELKKEKLEESKLKELQEKLVEEIIKIEPIEELKKEEPIEEEEEEEEEEKELPKISFRIP